MKKVTIYSTTHCGYCRSAKYVLENEEIPYTEIDVTNDDAKRQWLVQVTGHRTVPQIFIGEQPIGGYTELCQLIMNKQLRPILESGSNS